MEIALGLLELGGLTTASYFFFSLQDKKYKLMDLMNFINKATVFNPDLLTKIFSGNAPRTYLKSLRDFEEGKDYVRGMAFVQGIVDSKHPLISRLNKNTKLIFSSISVQSLFSNTKNFKPKIGSRSSKAVDKFELKDPNYGYREILPLSLLNKLSKFSSEFSNQKKSISEKFEFNPAELTSSTVRKQFARNSEIPKITVNLGADGENTQISPALELIHSTTTTRVLTSIETLMSYLIKALKFFLSMSSISKKIQGFKIGYKKIERGVRLGQFIVTFGEIFFDRKTKELSMKNPICLLKNKSQMLKKLRQRKLRLARQLSFTFGLMTIMGFLVVRRGVKICKGIYTKMRKMKEVKKMDKLFKLSRAVGDEYKCIICYDLAKHVIFKPCLHMACCKMCYEKLDKQVCIICKQEIEDVVTIYVK